ncbi:hypothetical protein E2C01_051663 [Portunus trituberculatus]|uniref:Uncharacterized protein n=1 Tax=Portunus trituberculatus TaxID=210409 RepID=A0A5B7GL38_PORTR|nr:hypothetical protein [Portunus trituberculatus]
MRGILPGTFLLPKPAPQAHPPSKKGHPHPPPLHLTHPCQIHCTPKTSTSVPTLAPHPTPFQAPIPAPILDPTPAPTPTKPLSPIISMPPTPKAQQTHHHHKPHHTVIPRHTTKPSFIPKGLYRTDLTDAGEFVSPNPLHQCHPPKAPQPKAPQPAAQQPLPSLGSAGFVPSSSSLQAQHTSGFAWPAFTKGLAPIALDFFNFLLSGYSFSENLLQCLPGLLSFITSLTQ